MLRMLETLSNFFSLFLVGLAGFIAFQVSVIPAIAILYCLPPLTWQLVSWIYEVPHGSYRIGKTGKPSAWMIYYNLQYLFTIAPWVEKLLLIVPGLYSAWLRSWGSQIGKKVIWTPGVTIVDRGHLEIGDFAFFGNQTYISAHVISRKEKRYILYIKPVKVGTRAFVGAWSMLGPGAKVEDHASLPIYSTLYETRTGVQYESTVQ